MITNPHRKKIINEFLDKNHAVMTEYYDLTEDRMPSKKLKAEMMALIKRDPDFYDPYLAAAEMEYYFDNDAKGNELIQEAYQRAVKRIVDYRGNWPKRMPWGWLENRHLMRAIEHYAYYIAWENGNTDEALDIFRKLLRANTGDNQGVRYSILAIRLGLGTDWQDQFIPTSGPAAGFGMDAIKVDAWFDKNAKKFPDEFDWLFKEWRKMES